MILLVKVPHKQNSFWELFNFWLFKMMYSYSFGMFSSETIIYKLRSWKEAEGGIFWFCLSWDQKFLSEVNSSFSGPSNFPSCQWWFLWQAGLGNKTPIIFISLSWHVSIVGNVCICCPFLIAFARPFRVNQIAVGLVSCVGPISSIKDISEPDVFLQQSLRFSWSLLLRLALYFRFINWI